MLLSSGVYAQYDSTKVIIDSLGKKTIFNSSPRLRIGADISYPVRYLFTNEIKGFEVVADYRLKPNKWFIAAEGGYATGTQIDSVLNYTTQGPYIKVGADRILSCSNKRPNNIFYIGARYCYSSTSTTVNSYTIRSSYWPTLTESIPSESGSVHSLEGLMGVKVEIFKHFFMGWTAFIGIPISNNKPESFDNLFIPGLGFQHDPIFGFNYTLLFTIPSSGKK
ncbi:DUF6048 family protein [Solitalea koreensis]|uniref:DUF6048 family protein n=1 Tax=Solitalea koreensis TaxID=543615 RepID=UPI001157E73B|nr:DUF6048 family protein [Solitalea koreensis]